MTVSHGALDTVRGGFDTVIGPLLFSEEESLKLTAITITSLKPREADYRVADGDGLYLLVRPNGSKL